ncbi:MAG: hypothetical protein NZ518_03675 [Dehalococcoidia bacterium]|nr:hypothetical protein [Dehalococcoidia bacterium]
MTDQFFHWDLLFVAFFAGCVGVASVLGVRGLLTLLRMKDPEPPASEQS